MKLLTNTEEPRSTLGREYVKTIPPLSDKERYAKWRFANDSEFFAKSALKIESESKLISFPPNEQQQILWNIMRAMRIANLPVRVIILKARRMGMSTAVEGDGFRETSLQQFRRMRVVAHLDSSAKMIFDMSRLFYDELPPQVRPMSRYESRNELVFENPDAQTRSQNPGLRSRFTIATAGSKDVGRGGASSYLHLSEVAFYPNTQGLTTGLLQTVDYQPDTTIVLESTANGAGGYFHDQYWKHKEAPDKTELINNLRRDWEDIDALVGHLERFPGTVGYIPIFFSWLEFPKYSMPITAEAEREHLESSLDASERKLQEKHGATLEQLKWRRAKIDEFAEEADGISPVDLFRQEYPSTDREAFLVTGRTIFDSEALADMVPATESFRGKLVVMPSEKYSRAYKPNFLETPYGELKLYNLPKTAHQYAIGGDTSFAERGRDFAVLEVLDKETLEQVAEWHGLCDPDQLGRYAFALACFYKMADVAIERNNMGIASIIALRDSGYPKIYVPRSWANARQEMPLDRLGWDTTGSTKPKAIADLAEHIRKRKIKFNSQGLINECLSFRINERGKMEAEEGKHDDRVMAMAIALQCVIDYPKVSETPTLRRMIHQEDMRTAMTSPNVSRDPVWGDVIP